MLQCFKWRTENHGATNRSIKQPRYNPPKKHEEAIGRTPKQSEHVRFATDLGLKKIYIYSINVRL
jgi:hypothetical protein